MSKKLSNDELMIQIMASCLLLANTIEEIYYGETPDEFKAWKTVETLLLGMATMIGETKPSEQFENIAN